MLALVLRVERRVDVFAGSSDFFSEELSAAFVEARPSLPLESFCEGCVLDEEVVGRGLR